jgi:phage-related protein
VGQPIDTAYVEVRPDVDRFGTVLARRLNTALGQAQRNVDDRLKETAARAGARGEEAGDRFGSGFTRGADGRLRDARGRFVAEGRTAGDAYGGGFIGGFGLRLGRLGSLIGNATKGLAGLATGAAQLAGLATAAGAGAAALAGLASAAAGAIPIVVELATVLASAAGTLVILPGVVAGLITVVGTLKVGLSGLGDAFKAVAEQDAAVLNEALKELAPNARSFVREVDRLYPALEGLQLNVQNALFKGLAATLRDVANNVLPTVGIGMIRLAQVINSQLRDAIGDLNTEANRLNLESIFASVATVIYDLGPGLAAITQGLLDVARAGLDVVTTLSGDLGSTLAALGDRLSAFANSGELARVFNDGLAAAGQLVGLLGDVLGIVTGIAGAAGGDGGLFAFFTRLNEAVNSVQGQNALSTLFAELANIGNALTPVLLALAQALGPVAGGIADIAVAFSPTLIALANALGQVLASLAPTIIALQPAATAVVGALAPLGQILASLVTGAAPGLTALIEGLVGGLNALAPVAPIVGQAFSNLATALAPLLPLIGQQLAVALAGAAGAISEISLVLGPLIGQFAQGFTVALQALLPIILEAASNILPIMAEAGIQLAQALLPLVPALTQIALLFAGQLATYLPQFAALAQQLVPVIAQLAAQFGQNLIVVLAALAPHFPALIDAGVQMALSFGQLVVAAAPLIALAAQISAGFAVLVLRSNLFKIAVGLLSFAVTGAAGVLRIVGAVIQALTGPIQAAAGAARQLGDAFRAGATIAIGVVRSIPGAIRSALGNTGSLLYNAGKNIIQGLINGIKSMLGSLGNIASSVAGTIRDRLPFSPAKTGPLSGRGNPFYSGQAISNLLAAGMTSRTERVAAASDTLARAVAAPLPGAPDGSIATLNRLTAPARPTPPPVVTTASSAATDLTALAALIGRELRAALNGTEFRMTDVDRVVSRSVGYAANIASRTGGL